MRNKGQSLVDFPKDFTVIDIETTGLDSRYDEIIELSGIKIRNGKEIEQFSSLVKPKFALPEFISELTGITNPQLENSPHLSEVLSEFIDFIGDDIIVGHNVNFDINFLYDKHLQISSKELSNDFVDTLRLARFILSNLHHHRLQDIVEYYHLGDTVMHRGLADSVVTLDIFRCLQTTALEQFGSVEKLTEEFRRRANHPHPGLKASSVSAHKTEFDITHPLYGKCCVFTGALERMIRKEAFQIVVDRGGIVQDNITKDTNYLIVGSFDYSSAIKDGKSSKLKKAEHLILKGKDLTIISENVFYDMLEE